MTPNDPNIPPQSGQPSGEPPRIVTPAVVSTPEVRTVVNDADDLAPRYIHTELKKARQSLLLTQIVGALTLLGTIGYFSYIVGTIQHNLEPANAAQIATGVIAQKVDDQSQELASQAKQQLPKMIATLPDYALKQLPIQREQLENQIDSDLTTNLQEASKKVDGNFDEFISQNKDQMTAILKDGKDKQATASLGKALQAEFEKALKDTTISGGESAKSKLDQTLAALQQVDKQVARLAANKNLTPEEQKMRRAVAILAANINKGVQDNGLKVAANPS